MTNSNSPRPSGGGVDRDRDLAVVDVYRVADDAHPRVEHGLSGGDVVLPGMPRTAQDATLLAIFESVHIAGQCRADDAAQTDPRCLVRTRILQCVELAVEIENAHLATFKADNLASAGRDLVNARDNVRSHDSERSQARSVHRECILDHYSLA